MPASETLRVRVEPALARSVRRWARRHGTDTSETIRIALRRLLEEEERARKVEGALREFERFERAGLFDPPTGHWKASGGWK